MRIWECDRCERKVRSLKKPEGWYDVKFFACAQSKGGKSFGCNLCPKCALLLFKVVSVWEREEAAA